MISKKNILINAGEEYLLKSVSSDDISLKYLKAINSGFIENKSNTKSLNELKKEINYRIISEKHFHFGLYFENELIGTSGIIRNAESRSVWTDLYNKYNTNINAVGVLIFDSKFKNKGLGSLLVWGACKLSHLNTGDIIYCAGIESENFISQKCFSNNGFKIFRKYNQKIQYYLDINDLDVPRIIRNYNVI